MHPGSLRTIHACHKKCIYKYRAFTHTFIIISSHNLDQDRPVKKNAVVEETSCFSAIATTRIPDRRSRNEYILFIAIGVDYLIDWSKRYDTSKKDRSVPGWNADRGREMEILDFVFSARRNQTLWGIAAAHSAGFSTNADLAIARVGADGDTSSGGVRAGSPKG
jgi:hypothetical protein